MHSARIEAITARMRQHRAAPRSQGVRMLHGTARLTAAHQVHVDLPDGSSTQLEADAILISTGTRPRIPDWCTPTASGS
ncbi:MAG: hypothetical protein R2705_05705 [Ilumatobacteraceae bacterium]